MTGVASVMSEPMRHFPITDIPIAAASAAKKAALSSAPSPDVPLELHAALNGCSVTNGTPVGVLAALIT
jgi:hypothetical protein